MENFVSNFVRKKGARKAICSIFFPHLRDVFQKENFAFTLGLIEIFCARMARLMLGVFLTHGSHIKQEDALGFFWEKFPLQERWFT